jgi:electron-transferring-flavoprotein dehydrogenase
LEPGTVWHSFGYPEPEIFGFLYVHPERLVSVGIFVPSWMSDPSRTAYRYLQHYIQHPALWRVPEDGTLRSWGAKSLEESGRHGEPFLSGDGFARIGEGSGSTNMLTGSGVDEAWTTGTQLGEAVLELLRAGQAFHARRIWPDLRSPPPRKLGRARRARSGERPQRISRRRRQRHDRHGAGGTDAWSSSRSSRTFLRAQTDSPFAPGAHEPHAVKEAGAGRQRWASRLHDALLTVRGWPEIPFDGRLLVTQQDALLMGGKVQAMPGFADHVVFRNRGCASPARRRPASPCAPARRSRWARTACPPSSARSASTAAPACGTAANRRTGHS